MHRGSGGVWCLSAAGCGENNRRCFLYGSGDLRLSSQQGPEDEIDWQGLLGTHRTFLCTVRVLKDHVTQSTTEAHGGLNPRRLAIDSE